MGYNHYRFARKVGANLEINEDANLDKIIFNAKDGNYSYYADKAIAGSMVLNASEWKFYAYSDRDIRFVTVGTGKIRFGTYSSLSGESLSGYITIKDADGTERKLAVIS